MADHIALDPYKIEIGDTDYPATHDSMLDAIEDGVNEGIDTANAAESAAQAATNDAYIATSSSTFTPTGSGSRTFILNETDRAYTVGSELKITSATLYTNWMKGVVTSYSGITLIVSLSSSNGSTSKSDWTIGLYGTSGILSVLEDTTPQLGGDLDCNSNQILKDSYTQATDILTTPTTDIDFTDGALIQITADVDMTSNITTSNFPSGAVCSVIIDAVNWGSITVDHPVAWKFARGIAPSYTVLGTDRLLLTKDGDGFFTLSIIALNMKTV